MESTMHPSSCSDIDQAPFPAPAQVALALFVLKSKPPEATVEDHLNHLRTHIIRGNATAQRTTSQHLDGAAYWKQAYERAEDEKAALFDRLYELEKHKAASTIPSSPTERSSLGRDRKRRREDTPAAKANSRSKRRASTSKTTESPTKEGQSARGRGALFTNDCSTDHTKLLQAFFSLRLQLRSQRIDLPTILSSARRLCHTICAIVKGVDKSAEAAEASEADTGLWEAIHRIYGSIVEAMDLLHTGSKQSGGASALISDLAKVLTEMLKTLRALTLREQPQKTGVRTRRRSPEHSCTLATELSRLIVFMMTTLNLDKEWHRELFEALAYVFLEHIGSRLSMVVFSEPETLGEPSTMGLMQPRGVPVEQEGETPSDLAMSLKEAPHLITILRTISSFANEDSEWAIRLPSTKTTQKDGCGTAILTRMQNTMLHGIFGDQDETFRDSLRRPSETESTDDVQNLMTAENGGVTSEWFVGEVWEYIGWDILTKYIG